MKRNFALCYTTSAVALLAAVATGCSADTQQGSGSEPVSSQSSASSVNDNSSGGSLGSGFDVQRQVFLGDCVTGTLELIDPGEGTLGLTRELTQEDLSKQTIDVKVGGSARIGAFNINAEAQFKIETPHNNYTDTAVFAVTTAKRRYRLKNPTPTAAALAEKSRAGSESVKNFCGTEFVHSVELGTNLEVAITFTFANEQVKSDFNAKVHLDYAAIFSLDGAVHTAYEDFRDSVSVSITAYQRGGTPARLAEILGHTATAGATSAEGAPSTGIASLECSVTDLKKCTEALQNIAEYARKSFVQQVTGTVDAANGGVISALPPGYGIVNYETKNYRDVGLGALIEEDSPLLKASIALARTRVYDRFIELSQDRRRLDKLLKGDAFRLTEEEQTKFKRAAAKVDAQLAEIEPVGKDCFIDFSKCEVTVNTLLNKFDNDEAYTYASKSLVKPLGFYEYCMSSKKTPALLNTLNAVATYLGRPDGTCDAKAAKFENITVLDLPGTDALKLSDIRPLASGYKLRTIRMPGHTITDIDPIMGLPNLQVLDLHDNTVTGIELIGQMKELTKLNLSYNNVKELHPLEDLSKIEELRIQGNPILDLEYYKAPQTLRVSILNENDVCRFERDAVRHSHETSDELVDAYEKKNWAPVYNVAGDRTSGIATWTVCKAVAASLPAAT
jgi:hypothetical protein